MSADTVRASLLANTNLEDTHRSTVSIGDEQEYVPVDEEYARIISEDKPSLDNFARGEVLSHELPYELAKSIKAGDRKKVTVIDEDGVEREYEARALHTKHDGLKAFALVGSDADNSRVKVLFRGTACGASVIRDLESYGAGQESFDKSKDLLLGQVFSIIDERAKATGKKIKLEVAGHSLGGADTQNFTAALAESCAKRVEEKRLEERSSSIGSKVKSAARKLFGSCLKRMKKPALKNANAVDHIESVEMHVANSAGVSKKTAKRFKKSVGIINDPLHARDERAAFSLNFLMVAGDGVQQTGQTSIGADIDPMDVHVRVLKVDTGQGKKCANYWNPVGAIQGIIGTTAAHTSKHFIGRDSIPAELSYTLLSNQASDAERSAIEKKLTKKSWFENSSVAYWIKKAAIGLARLFKSCKKTVPQDVAELAEAVEATDIDLAKMVMLERREVEHVPARRARTTDDLSNSVLFASETRSSLLRQYGTHVARQSAIQRPGSFTDDTLLDRRRREKTIQHARQCGQEAITQSMICHPLPAPRIVCR